MSADIRGKAAANVEASNLSPGERLRAEIERLGLDQVAVSKATGVSRQSINNIINGRQPISRAMAGKLARLTGHSSDYWLREVFPRSGTASDQPRTVRAGVLVNHEILRAVKTGIIAIKPFTAQNVQAATINLTLNDTVMDGKKRINIRAGKGYLLKTGRTVAVSTKENIQLAADFVGRIGTVNELASRGIMASHPLQVEPGFTGHVHVCLFNAGAADVRLRAEEAVISLEIAILGARPTAVRAAT